MKEVRNDRTKNRPTPKRDETRWARRTRLREEIEARMDAIQREKEEAKRQKLQEEALKEQGRKDESTDALLDEGEGGDSISLSEQAS